MPLLSIDKITPIGEIGIWEVKESEAFFRSSMELYPEEICELDGLSQRKRLEWLSARQLLHIMSGRLDRGGVFKDHFGKPYLDASKYNISLSHSGGFTAVIASPLLVGVDIQYFTPKIARIAPKFITEKEMTLVNTEQELLYYHLIWGAKESLFKAYGKGKVDFRKDLSITKITHNNHKMYAKGLVNKVDFIEEFNIEATIFESYILVYAINE